MSDQHEINRAHEARIAEVERRLAASEQATPVARSRLLRGRVAALGLILALLTLPGAVLASHQFADVPDSHPFHDDIDWMADYGIANGFSDGTYRPGQAVTRQAMAAFTHRLSNEFEIVADLVDPAPATSFTFHATCPEDKRSIGGGGSADELVNNLFMTDSTLPLLGPANSWVVRWESENDAVVDPGYLLVFTLCAPRL